LFAKWLRPRAGFRALVSRPGDLRGQPFAAAAARRPGFPPRSPQVSRRRWIPAFQLGPLGCAALAAFVLPSAGGETPDQDLL